MWQEGACPASAKSCPLVPCSGTGLGHILRGGPGSPVTVVAKPVLYPVGSAQPQRLMVTAAFPQAGCLRAALELKTQF